MTSNIRVTTKVAVHALLSKELRDVGSALVYNMVIKEVKTAVSLHFFHHFLSSNRFVSQEPFVCVFCAAFELCVCD